MKTILIAERWPFSCGPLRECGFTWTDACNLLPPGAWNAEKARATAEAWAKDLERWDVVMLAGRRVAVAFGLGGVPFLGRKGLRLVLPHSSRWLNDAGNRRRARELANWVARLAADMKVTGLREAWE